MKKYTMLGPTSPIYIASQEHTGTNSPEADAPINPQTNKQTKP
jgi:hypothetical protein